jgi:hypothetical protein
MLHNTTQIEILQSHRNKHWNHLRYRYTENGLFGNIHSSYQWTPNGIFELLNWPNALLIQDLNHYFGKKRTKQASHLFKKYAMVAVAEARGLIMKIAERSRIAISEQLLSLSLKHIRFDSVVKLRHIK